MVLANGGERVPSRELIQAMAESAKQVRKQYRRTESDTRNKLEDYMDDEVLAVMKELRKGNVED